MLAMVVRHPLHLLRTIQTVRQVMGTRVRQVVLRRIAVVPTVVAVASAECAEAKDARRSSDHQPMSTTLRKCSKTANGVMAPDDVALAVALDICDKVITHSTYKTH